MRDLDDVLLKSKMKISESDKKGKYIHVPLTEDELDLILANNHKLGAIMAFVTIMQDGDPENENPKKILDEIDSINDYDYNKSILNLVKDYTDKLRQKAFDIQVRSNHGL